MDSLRKGDVIVVGVAEDKQFGRVDDCNDKLGPNNYVSVRWLKENEWAPECEFLQKETQWRLATHAEVDLLPPYRAQKAKTLLH